MGNIEPFSVWLERIMNQVYLFHGWGISGLPAKIEQIRQMIESGFNDETREEVEYYLLHGEFSKYRKYLVAADFFPSVKDFPDLISNYIKRSDLEKKMKEYNASIHRQAKAEAYEEAFRDFITNKDESTNQLIKMMKEQLSFRSKYDEIQKENKKLQGEIDSLKRQIKKIELIGEAKI